MKIQDLNEAQAAQIAGSKAKLHSLYSSRRAIRGAPLRTGPIMFQSTRSYYLTAEKDSEIRATFAALANRQRGLLK